MIFFVIFLACFMAYMIYRLFKMKRGMDKSINDYILYKRKNEFEKINEMIKKDDDYDLVDFENEIIEDLEKRNIKVSELIDLQEEYRDLDLLEKAFMEYKKIKSKNSDQKADFYLRKIRNITKEYYKKEI